MPANLTPEYIAAEARFKAAQEPGERIEALEHMLRVIPKHKGTDHLRGDLKKKLSQLREDARGAKRKGGVRKADPGQIPRQGAGQVVLLGPANSGKSSLLAALTNAEPEIGDYPYTTQKPQPGMMKFEDAPIQLVDCLAAESSVFQSWMTTLLRRAHFGVVVLDPNAPGVLDALPEIEALLARSRVTLVAATWASDAASSQARPGDAVEAAADRELDDTELLARLEPGDKELPAVVAANKVDHGNNREQTEVLRELLGGRWPMLAVSAHSGEGLDELRAWVFHGLRMIRVYAKPPGKPPSTKEPITLPIGATVHDMARHIHKELAAGLRFARIWSQRHHDGQRITRAHVLEDGDIVEINM